MAKSFVYVILMVYFFAPSLFAQEVTSLISNLNRHAGNVNQLGPQTNLTPPLNPRLQSALELAKNPSVVERIQKLENKLKQAVRVLASPHASPQAKTIAAEKIARTGPRLQRLMAARAGLIVALNTNLRTSVAQAQGVKPYVSQQGAWLKTTFKIIKDVRGQMSKLSNKTGRQSSLARGVKQMFANNAYQIHSLIKATQQGRHRSTPTIMVEPVTPSTSH